MKYTVELNDWETNALATMMKTEFKKATEFIARNEAALKYAPELQSFIDMAEKERILYNKVYRAMRQPQPKKTPHQYPEHLEKKLLVDLELFQQEIDSMSRGETFDALLNYEGYVNCASQIKGFVRDIYGVDLDNLEG